MQIANELFSHNINRKETSNFILFSLGKFVSIFGSAIYTFAIGLYVLNVTGSGLSFATTLVLGVLPMIFIMPFAGVMADKFDKKKLVVSMDMLNGILLLLLYILSLTHGLNIMMIYATTFLMTVFTCFFSISFESAKPNIVSDKMLMNINSVSKIIDSISSILGPIIGGMVFAFFDIKMFILINGISFVFSSISEIFIDFKFNTEVTAAKKEIKKKVNFIKDVKEGIQYVLGRKDIIRILFIFVALNFFLSFSVSVPLPYIINNVLKLSSTQFGIIDGGFPVGMIIGALLITRIIKKVSYDKLLTRISFVISLSMLALGLPILLHNTSFSSTFYLLYYFITVVVFGIAMSFIDIPITFILQSIIPEEYRGRVISIAISIAKIVSPLALIISGLLINKLSSYVLPIGGGLLLAIFMAAALKAGSFKLDAVN